MSSAAGARRIRALEFLEERAAERMGSASRDLAASEAERDQTTTAIRRQEEALSRNALWSFRADPGTSQAHRVRAERERAQGDQAHTLALEAVGNNAKAARRARRQWLIARRLRRCLPG